MDKESRKIFPADGYADGGELTPYEWTALDMILQAIRLGLVVGALPFRVASFVSRGLRGRACTPSGDSSYSNQDVRDVMSDFYDHLNSGGE